MLPRMIELTADELAAVEHQMAQRPERRTRQQSWQAVDFTTESHAAGPRRTIAVASGKGGVGKSTITANLATLAAQRGLKVGVLDADLHGYSLTRLLGITQKASRLGPATPDAVASSAQDDGKTPDAVASSAQDDRGGSKTRNKIKPAEVFGVRVISIGMFTDPQKAVIWRGPVAHRALTQFLTDTDWGPLDLMFIDLPPGTGDIALSIANLLPNAEQLIVTSPQSASAEVAARSGAMAQHTHQKILGVVENMAWLETDTGQRLNLFGEGGGAEVAAQLSTVLGYQVDLLAQIPLDPQLPVEADQGKPIAIAHPGASSSRALTELAARIFGS